MPNFRLSDEEATELSAFLLSRAEDEKGAAPAGDATRGKTLFASSGCASCHVGVIDNASNAPQFDVIAKSDWTKGCPALGRCDHGNAPDFGLNDAQRGAARVRVERLRFARPRRRSEAAERQVTQLNCVACHVRDKQQDVWSTIKPEVDAFLATLRPSRRTERRASSPGPEPPEPDVRRREAQTGVDGEVHRRQIPYKPRPWIFARMPASPRGPNCSRRAWRLSTAAR
jgi:cytochrome c551/c552